MVTAVEKEGRELVGRYEMYVHNRGESAFAFVPCLFIFASFLPFFSPTPTDSAALGARDQPCMQSAVP